MDLLGTYKVSFDLLRSIVIECHALDVAAHHLLLDTTHLEGIEKTKAIYEELMTSRLLNLAVGLRTKFYEGIDAGATIRYISHCGLLYKYKSAQEESVNFSAKDVCDKIIHATSITRHLETGVALPTTTFLGTDPRNKSSWELSMSVSLFTEGILNWIHFVETSRLSISKPEQTR